MRLLLCLFVVLGVSLSAQAQDLRMLLPGPGTIVLTVGKWLLQDRDPVYEITVQGTGRTVTEARDQALRLAVHQALGSLVLSQTEILNGEVHMNRILNHSSGYVHRVHEHEVRSDASGATVVKITAWVKRSQLADGLIGQSETAGSIDGVNTARSLQSLQHQHSSGQELLIAVSREHPERSFDIKSSQTQWRLTRLGSAELTVSYQAKWNQNYIQSLAEAVQNTNELSQQDRCFLNPGGCDSYSYVDLQLRPGRHGRTIRAAYLNQHSYAQLHDAFVYTTPVMVVSLMDGMNTVLHRECHAMPAGFVEMTYRGFRVHAWYQHQAQIKVRRDFSASQAEDIRKITIALSRVC
jgi:hypothetical protein